MKTLKTKYQKLLGNGFFLEDDASAIENYLRSQRWLPTDVGIKGIEKPGEGNMNLVYRLLLTNDKSIIIKQARPWVEKYPQIEATTERIAVEYRFYKEQSNFELLSTFSPHVLGFDAKNHVLLLEDLGEASDFSFVYQKDKAFKSTHLKAASNYLNHLMHVKSASDYPANLDLRKLNHQHIFHLPFVALNEFDLDDIQPGLQTLANSCKQDDLLIEVIRQLGEVYLSDGDVLLHGDFYPGSLLDAKSGLKVIDPEFSFVGPAEWDQAVFIAHLFLAQTPFASIKATFDQIIQLSQFDYSRFVGFVGAEILRRLIGLAQLPLVMTLDEKEKLITDSITWIKEGIIPGLNQ